MNHTDPLSQWPDHDDRSKDNLDVTILPEQLFVWLVDITDLETAIIHAQHTHESTIRSWAQTYLHIKQVDNMWWNDDCLVVVEGNTLRRGVISLYHNSTTAGHPKALKTCLLLAKDFWWPGMGPFVQNYVKGCATCQATKAATTKPKPPLFSITMDPNAFPFKNVAIDLIVKLSPSQGYDSILTITDHGCSKAAIMIPCHKAIDAEGMAQLYEWHVFPHYGISKCIISDRDPHFALTFNKELCHCLGIQQNISMAYHP